MSKSAPVSKRTRYEVLRRDNFCCRYCGRAAPEVVLVLDHVTPRALGGSNEPSNLVAACEDCNGGKSATPPGPVLIADVAQRQTAWASGVTRSFREQQAVAARNRTEDCLDFYYFSWDRGHPWDRSSCRRKHDEEADRQAVADAWDSDQPPQFPEEHIPCTCVPTSPPLPDDWRDHVAPVMASGVTYQHLEWLCTRYPRVPTELSQFEWVMKWAWIEAGRIAERREFEEVYG